MRVRLGFSGSKRVYAVLLSASSVCVLCSAALRGDGPPPQGHPARWFAEGAEKTRAGRQRTLPSRVRRVTADWAGQNRVSSVSSRSQQRAQRRRSNQPTVPRALARPTAALRPGHHRVCRPAGLLLSRLFGTLRAGSFGRSLCLDYNTDSGSPRQNSRPRRHGARTCTPARG